MNLDSTLARLRGALSLLIALGLAASAGAQTVWTGAQDSLFSQAANWSNGLPADGNAGIIPGGAEVVFAQALNGDFDLQSFGDLTLRAKVDVRGDWQLSGALAIVGDRLNVFGSVMNFGSVEVDADGSIFLSPDGRLRTNGTIANAGWIGFRGTFRNEGTIAVLADAVFTSYETGLFENPGVIDVEGKLVIQRTGDYTAPSGGTINVEDGGLLRATTGGTIANAGIIRVDDGGRFEQRANFDNNPGRTFVSGVLATYAGSATSSNFLTVEEGGVLNVDDAESFEVAFSLQNFGTARVNRAVTVRGLITNGATGAFTVTGLGELDFVVGTNLNNEGTFTNRGRITTVGTITNDEVFVNDGDIAQDGNGAIVNNDRFTNEKRITSIDRIVNNGAFRNEGRITNGSGGQIVNNATLVNVADAHIENLFEIFNRDLLVNDGFFENGVSLFNEAEFRNNGFLDNVGDVVNAASAVIDNSATGVIDNSGTGILTNDGVIDNRGEINNFACGIIVNNNLIRNFQWINNEGLFFQNGTVEGKPIMGDEGVVVEEGGTSSKICRPVSVSLDPDGRSTVGGTLFGAMPFDSCQGIIYLVNGAEVIDVTCADIGTQDVTLTLRDRRGNEVSCATTLTVVDDRQPKPDFCQGDIEVTVDEAPAAVDFRAPVFADNCDADLDVTFNKAPGDDFDEGATVVTYRAVDDSGNEFVCEFTVRVTLRPQVNPCVPQNPHGLLAYYNFAGRNATYVFDRSGFGDPLILKSEDTDDIRRDAECGLVNTGHKKVVSWRSASKIADRVGMTNALTVEAWVRADQLQSGPARVVTFSENVTHRNFTLGQEGNRWVFRLKTTHTDNNGMPNRLAAGGSVEVGEVQHVVFTRSANGQERFYVDGELSYSGHRGGDFSTWGRHCRLALFNEMTDDRAFRGAIKKVAIYDRALSADEVQAALALGACCEGDDSPLGQVCQGPRGRVSFERFSDLPGNDLSWLYKQDKFPKSPDATRKLTELSIPRDAGNDYGTRTRGWIYPEKTGNYQFAVSGDDQTRLFFSRNPGEAGFYYLVAQINGWTNPGELHKYNTQKSGVFRLEAGEAYFFELQQKQGGGGNHADVFWKVPGSSKFAAIGAAFIGDVETCESPEPPVAGCDRRGLLREVWTGINSTDIWALMDDPRYPDNPTTSGVIESFAGPANVADNYGTRVRGYITPEETGVYEFVLTGDDQTKLVLSTDADAANGRQIAFVHGWTRPAEYHKYPSQKSSHIRLTKGQRYYVELVHQEGRGGDHFNVRWKTPSKKSYHAIPGELLSPFGDCPDAQPQTCGKDVLLVVGSTQLNNGDAAAKHELTSLGYDVTVEDVNGATQALARTQDLVIVSSSINSRHLGKRFRDLDVPMIVSEAWLFDDMKMTGDKAGTDYGSDHTRTLEVDGAFSKLSGGLSGHTEVLSRNGDLAWGKVMGSDAKMVAYQTGDKWRVNVFVYEEGARMAGGLNAPNIRIGAPFTSRAAPFVNAAGRKLFRAIVAHATGCDLGGDKLLVNPDLLDLDARREFEAVSLVWTNNTAFKNEYFTVERASAGGDYEVIGTVEPRGEGDAIETFDFTDEAPLRGENVYRVTAMFNDATEATSQLRIVRIAERGNLTVYPNPASEYFTVALEDFGNAAVTMTISDQLGRKLHERTVEPGTVSIEIDAREYPVGAYSVTIANGGFVNSERVVVTRD